MHLAWSKGRGGASPDVFPDWMLGNGCRGIGTDWLGCSSKDAYRGPAQLPDRLILGSDCFIFFNRRTTIAPRWCPRHMGELVMAKEMEPAAAEETQAPAQQPQPQQMMQVEVDDAHVTASYANFCRVTGSPEELIIDFGLNPQPVGMPKNPIAVTQRCIVNYYTAKRLLHALSLSVQRHEAVFGVLETDIQKRVKPLTR